MLVRPAVEAGEHLGFLPGDLEAKINPILRPLLDALHDLMDYDQIRRYMDNDLIEIAPLAYMRGRTLNNAGHHSGRGSERHLPQMKMFLTRMGNNSKIVVTGDITQVDLPAATRRTAWSMPPSVLPACPVWRRCFSIARISSATPWSRPSSTRMKKKNRPAIVIETLGRPLRPAEANPGRERGPVIRLGVRRRRSLPLRVLPVGNPLPGFPVLHGPDGSIAQRRRVALAHSSVERPKR